MEAVFVDLALCNILAKPTLGPGGVYTKWVLEGGPGASILVACSFSIGRHACGEESNAIWALVDLVWCLEDLCYFTAYWGVFVTLCNPWLMRYRLVQLDPVSLTWQLSLIWSGIKVTWPTYISSTYDNIDLFHLFRVTDIWLPAICLTLLVLCTRGKRCSRSICTVHIINYCTGGGSSGGALSVSHAVWYLYTGSSRPWSAVTYTPTASRPT